MSDRVLVAYSTRSGSTEEVARAVGIALREAGLDADVLPMPSVNSVEGYAALVLGAPLYIGSFPKTFRPFLARHHAALCVSHPWLFVLGPTRDLESDFAAARKQAEKQLARDSWLHPVELRIFGGCWNPATLPFPFSLARRLPGSPLSKIPAADIRDWLAIHAWAESIAQQIKPAA